MSAEENLIAELFPRLRFGGFQVTSPETNTYNCIAWAAEDQCCWWWPSGPYWPGAVQPDDSLNAFIQAFGGRGYIPCANGAIEDGFQKIVLYVDNSGSVTHAARQLPDGRWTSKLGRGCDIVHRVDGLDDSSYGRIAQFLKRPL